jgi:hypothetical protein
MKAVVFLILLFALDVLQIDCGSDRSQNNANLGNGQTYNAGQKVMPMPNAAVSEVKLQSVMRKVSPTQIKVNYSVTNESKSGIFLLNRLPARGADFQSTSADAHYITFEADGRADISKRAYFLDPNETASSAALILPAALRLAAGESFSEEFNVALPLVAKHPYKSAPRVATPEGRVRQARFCLGYVFDTGAKVKTAEINGETLIKLNLKVIRDQQQIICGEAQMIE